MPFNPSFQSCQTVGALPRSKPSAPRVTVLSRSNPLVSPMLRGFGKFHAALEICLQYSFSMQPRVFPLTSSPLLPLPLSFPLLSLVPYATVLRLLRLDGSLSLGQKPKQQVPNSLNPSPLPLFCWNVLSPFASLHLRLDGTHLLPFRDPVMLHVGAVRVVAWIPSGAA